MGTRVSVIIPSLDGHRGGAVPRLLESVNRQNLPHDVELHVIKGISPQGKAINLGARQARGDILIILDDDSRLADEHVFKRLVDTLNSDPAIGMVGASIVSPPDATRFQLRAAKQFPRFSMPIVNVPTESDMACHGCCAIPRGVFEEIGGEREDIPRGLDPDLRMRLRNNGYLVVLAPNAIVYHPVPDGWRNLSRIFFRNGYGSAYAQKFHPECVLDTHERLNSAGFQPHHSFAYRAARFPLRLLRALMRFQLMRFGAYCAYAVGYVWALLSARDNLANIASDVGADEPLS